MSNQASFLTSIIAQYNIILDNTLDKILPSIERFGILLKSGSWSQRILVKEEGWKLNFIGSESTVVYREEAIKQGKAWTGTFRAIFISD